MSHTTMKRAAIYARYSSDKQNEESNRDQIRLCEEWAEKNNIQVVAHYYDEAKSGGSLHNRSGLDNLMRDAESKQFDIVICESTDRISRQQGDLANIRRDLDFFEVKIFTTERGEVDAFQVCMSGLIGERYLVELGHKTRRGLESCLEDGRIPCGKSYGYDSTSERGVFSINESQADIVRRIFLEFIAGATPRQIATGLNKDNIPGPRGGKWNASTINGSKVRQNGILQNRLYNGVYVMKRQKFIKDPRNGKRVSRPNPESEWKIKELPQYKIIDDEIFQKAAAIKAERSTDRSPVKKKKPKHLLTLKVISITKALAFPNDGVYPYQDLGDSQYRSEGISLFVGKSNLGFGPNQQA